jgi:hypothetical protein
VLFDWGSGFISSALKEIVMVSSGVLRGGRGLIPQRADRGLRRRGAADKEW